jgi:hypothetical protein
MLQNVCLFSMAPVGVSTTLFVYLATLPGHVAGLVAEPNQINGLHTIHQSNKTATFCNMPRNIAPPRAKPTHQPA